MVKKAKIKWHDSNKAINNKDNSYIFPNATLRNALTFISGFKLDNN